ncbi:hypothetical protein KFE25_003990 [Diacronema lutheri]|uniref:Uncharacterized protein n=1 Tax=Diacronema lutheri TaxID=2081491 RepID=A0A8J6C6N3_DIALT|nr:hypothetical protein KFE25_003990 [Diacronema lutheri]
MSLARPDTDLLDILSATTGSFAVQEESARDDAIRLKTEALERWTTIAGRPQVANPALNDLASRIQELTREKHRLYQSIHTRQALLFG